MIGSATARWWAPPVTLLLAACATACTAEATPTEAAQPSPFADCGDLTSPPPASAPGGMPAAADLPDLELPCFTGGRPVRLTEIRGPAVLSLWASWCPPCRAELPAMQQLADRANGRLRVIGVDSYDGRDAAASFGADHRITIPTIFDHDQKLLASLGRSSLPVTVIIDAAGRRFVEPLPLDLARLPELVRAHTGVTVAP